MRPRLHLRRSRQTRRQRASPARRHPRQRTDGRPGRRSPGAFAARTAELHRLPCRRRRGLEGLVGGKGADQVPHHAGRRRRVQGEGAGGGVRPAVVFFNQGGAMHPQIHLNWVAVVVAVVASFFFGWLWYRPLFGKKSATLMKIPTDMRPDPKVLMRGMVLMVIGTFLTTYVLAYSSDI